ncbi:MAG: T9SS type A sorting domain-containing protein [Candidatus Cloacimonetes bacterium]|nr:T9SS type A sorting domain-containing protein [Candidatus Cloacimonadota bacterium]
MSSPGSGPFAKLGASFCASIPTPEDAMRFWILLLVMLSSLSHAAVLRVPADHPGVQAAMDASQAGDTVRVDRGVWTGLLDSPAHTLLLCSNYPFTQDSTDIAETILDGEYVGTILNVHTGGDELLTVRGLTFWRGQGHRDSNSGYHIRAGAVQMVSGVSAVFEDVVFADCRAPDMASILFHGVYNSASYSTGSLILSRIHCRGTQVETNNLLAHAFQIHATQSRVIVDGFYWDGGSTDCPVLKQWWYVDMDSLALANVRIVNCTGNANLEWYGFNPTNNSSIFNIYSEGCSLSLRKRGEGTDGSTMVVRNIEITGCDSTRVLRATPNVGPVLFDNIHVHHNRMMTNQTSMIYIECQEENGTELRNLSFHDNILGDSTSAAFNRPYPFISLARCDLFDASIRNNAVILPADPNVGDTRGNWTLYNAMVWMAYGNRRLEDVLFENNRVDDLDVYTDVRPEIEPSENHGREFMAWSVDTMVVRNLTVHNSRMDNPIPEVSASDDIGYSGPGFTVWFNSDYLDAKGVLLENCDDGGIWFGSQGHIEGAILRNVKRAAFGITGNSGSRALRNVHVQTVVGGANWLPLAERHYSKQAFLWAWGESFNLTPTIELDNVTVVGCSNIRHLFNIWNPATLIVRNSVFHNNSYDQMLQLVTPTSQTWEYNILEEGLPGIGNQVGVDPLFDEELGAPWLSPISPAIDAGHPDTAYDDTEDPDNPGFALWPSQGALRNDIGYTGGPHAGTLDHLVAVQSPRENPITLPVNIELLSAYPNPFNPATTISYLLNHPMQVELTVHNLLGQTVRALVSGMQGPGEHSVRFQAGELASGVYLVQLNAGGQSRTRKILLLK